MAKKVEWIIVKDFKSIKCLENENPDIIFDFLTKTLNKEYLFQYLNDLIYQKKPFSLYFFDVDEFKKINDTYGHSFGDYILEKITSVISSAVGDRAIIGRYGGDEFMIIAEYITSYDDVWGMGRDISKAVRDFSSLEAKNIENFFASITIGISRFPNDADNLDTLLSLADKALYRGKKKGRNCFIIYNPILHSQISTSSNSALDTVSLIQYAYSELLDDNKTLRKKLENLSLFLSSNYFIDSIAINNPKKKKFTYYYHIKSLPSFDSLPSDFYDGLFKDDNLCIINTREYLYEKYPTVYNSLLKQEIRATMIIRLKINPTDYIYVHINVHRARVWSHEEKNVMLAVYQMFGALIYNRDIEY